jgi:hypothetical protein
MCTPERSGCARWISKEKRKEGLAYSQIEDVHRYGSELPEASLESIQRLEEAKQAQPGRDGAITALSELAGVG